MPTSIPKSWERAIALIKADTEDFDIFPTITQEPGSLYDIGRTSDITWLDILRQYATTPDPEQNKRFLKKFFSLVDNKEKYPLAFEIYSELANGIEKYKNDFFKLFYGDTSHIGVMGEQDSITKNFIVELALGDPDIATIIVKNSANSSKLEPHDYMKIIDHNLNNKEFVEELAKRFSNNNSYANPNIIAKESRDRKSWLIKLCKDNTRLATSFIQSLGKSSPLSAADIVSIIVSKLEQLEHLKYLEKSRGFTSSDQFLAEKEMLLNFSNVLQSQQENVHSLANLTICAQLNAKAAGKILMNPKLMDIMGTTRDDAIKSIAATHLNDPSFYEYINKHRDFNPVVYMIVGPLNLLHEASKKKPDIPDIKILSDTEFALAVIKSPYNSSNELALLNIIFANINNDKFMRELKAQEKEYGLLTKIAKEHPGNALDILENDYLSALIDDKWNEIIKKHASQDLKGTFLSEVKQINESRFVSYDLFSGRDNTGLSFTNYDKASSRVTAPTEQSTNEPGNPRKRFS